MHGLRGIRSAVGGLCRARVPAKRRGLAVREWDLPARSWGWGWVLTVTDRQAEREPSFRGAAECQTGYNGPWIVVAPQFVPRPILLVPTRYYHAPPGHWQQWEARQPPRWHEEYGREWADKREWRGHEHEREDEQGENRGHGHGRD